MKTYQIRNELSRKDQHKHVYIELPSGFLVLIRLDMIVEENGIIKIKLDSTIKQHYNDLIQ